MEESEHPAPPADRASEAPTEPEVNHRTLEDSIRVIGLCTDALESIRKNTDDPGLPETRADFLLEVEHLAEEVARLLRLSRRYAWGSEEPPPMPEED